MSNAVKKSFSLLQLVFFILACWFIKSFVSQIIYVSSTLNHFETLVKFFQNPLKPFSFRYLFNQEKLDLIDLHWSIVVCPIFEELVFRLGVFNYLKKRFHNRSIPILASSFLFSLYHLDLPIQIEAIDFTLIFQRILGGIIYAYEYETTKIIGVPIVLHSLYNLSVTIEENLRTPYESVYKCSCILIGFVISVIFILYYLRKREFHKKAWFWSGVVLFIFLSIVASCFYPSYYDFDFMRKSIYYAIAVLCSFVMVVMFFIGNEIKLKSFFTPVKIDFVLIFKAICFVFFAKLIIFLPEIIHAFKFRFDYFIINKNKLYFLPGVIFSGQPSLIKMFIWLNVTVAPLLEEIIFRKILYHNLKEKTNTVLVAAVASAVAFGFYYVLLHGDDMTIIFQIFAAGIALAYVYEVSGSIWSAIVLHYLINWMTTLNGYLSKTYREVFACLFYPIVIVVVGVSVVKYLRKSGKL